MSQPRALFFLAFTELWERFGFYVIQGLLVLFLTQYFSYTDENSYVLLGEFTALAYIAPILGGFIADQLLGFRLTILISIVLLCIGYFILSTLQLSLLRVGLALVVTGNGLLKPNISSFLGRFYKKGDPRRESGYTIFYVFISFGIIISTLSSGWIANEIGWSAVFYAAAFGMALAFIIFLMGYPCYFKYGLVIKARTITFKINRILANRGVLSGLLLLATVLFYYMLISKGASVYIQFSLAIALIVCFIYSFAHSQEKERHNLIILGILLLISVLFWMLFFQLYLTLILFIHRVVDRRIWGIEIPTVTFSTLEPLFVICLGMFFSKLWQRISRRRRNPTYVIKFGLSMIFASISMALLILAIHLTPGAALVNPIWVVFIYFFMTLGEMMLYPIGMAMVTVLVPKKFTGVMMGVWFMTLGFGGMLAGELAEIADIPVHTSSIVVIKHIYQHAFSVYAMIGLVAVVVIFSVYYVLNKLGIKPRPV